MILTPNAKINLGLDVVARRSDGFHDIETLFVPSFSLSDVLEVVKADTFDLHQYGIPCGVEPEKNLCYKAFKLMKDRYGISDINIFLYKNIPTGAGLGGGSSDAAHTLIALNEIFALGLDRPSLASLAAELGSDCPFFIYNRPMLASGRGEKLEPFNIDLRPYRIEVVTSNIHISTPEAYSMVDSYKDKNGWQKTLPLAKRLKLPASEWPENLINDFEPPVFAKYPALEKVKNDLYSSGAVYASMTGSGSAIYGLFPK